VDAADRERRIQTICLLILSGGVIAAALYLLRAAMIPFVLALFFSFSLRPLIDIQEQYLRLPRAVAGISTLVLGLLVFTALAGLITVSVSQLGANAPAYQAKLEQLLRDGAALLQRHGVQLPPAFNPFSLIRADNVGNMLVGTTNALLGILSQSVIVGIFLVFMVLGSVRRERRPGDFWSDVESQIQRYVLTKALTSAATGGIVGAILAILGVDLALMFGLLAFLLNFIPSIGSIIATLLPLPVVLVSPDVSGTVAVLAIVLPGIVQAIIGNVLEPRAMGTSLDLHPIAILVTLILWGTMWGPVGMLLATPITAVMKILFARFDLTAPVAELLAGRLRGMARAA
jgi:AI-2 transport protein TqsA